MAKIKTSFTITQGCKSALRQLAERWGISQSSAVEIAVREKNQRETVEEIARWRTRWSSTGDKTSAAEKDEEIVRLTNSLGYAAKQPVELTNEIVCLRKTLCTERGKKESADVN